MNKQLQLPVFKYLPHAFELGLFSKEKFTCDICKTEREYRYIGPFYVEKKKSKGTNKVTNSQKKICPWCIESGKAAEILNADFKDVDILEQTCYNKEHLDEEICDAVIQTWLYRTPNFVADSTELWPICCNDFTSFVGYLGTGDKRTQNLNLEKGESLSEITAILERKSVTDLFLELDDALALETERLNEIGYDIENGSILADRLKTEENNIVGYLFKCLECKRYRLHVDFIQKP